MTPAGGAVPLVNLFLGEVIFGGVGSGLYGMFFYIVIAVFVAGPDGRPDAGMARQEDRGARDQVRGGRRALRADDGADADRALDRRPRAGSPRSTTSGVHGFTETLYAYDSQANNNGSAFAGFGATNFSADFGDDRDATSAASCRCSRRSRSAARWRRRRSCRPRPGRSAPTAPTFVVLLVGVIVLTAGLMIFPALTLGPIVEGLMH